MAFWDVYRAVSGIGDDIAAGRREAAARELDRWKLAQSQAILSGEEAPPMPEYKPFGQQLIDTFTGGAQPAAKVAVSPPAQPAIGAPANLTGGKLDYAGIQNLLLRNGATPEEARIMPAIALAESRGNPQALNPNRATGDLSHGLFQINMLDKLGPERRARWGLKSNEELYNPDVNAKAALDLARSRGGYSDWSVYKSGDYKKYLPSTDMPATPTQVADASDVLKGFPKGLQTEEGIMRAMQNPGTAALANKAYSTLQAARQNQAQMDRWREQEAIRQQERQTDKAETRAYNEQLRQDRRAERAEDKKLEASLRQEKITEAQANAATFATRMDRANKIISDPAVFSAGLGASGALRGAAASIPVVGNVLAGSGDRGPKYQQYDQAKRDFVNAALRKESGAVITPAEFDNAEKQYFPRPGDSPQVIAQKAANRRTAIETISNAAGPALKGLAAPPEIGGGRPQQPPPPNIGAVVRGFRFKGGDPALRASWEKAE